MSRRQLAAPTLALGTAYRVHKKKLVYKVYTTSLLSVSNRGIFSIKEQMFFLNLYYWYTTSLSVRYAISNLFFLQIKGMKTHQHIKANRQD